GLYHVARIKQWLSYLRKEYDEATELFQHVRVLNNSPDIARAIQAIANEKMASDGRAQLDRDAYCNRNVVERCFGRLKEYRRIATRYDKTARNYLAMVKLGCIRLFYQRLRN
ncbi:transposase, partial [Shigella flexneri]|uniref:transposase n=1 Tax=Shigella flexneri TaxID=623 RepID=UPI001EE6EAD6